MPDSASHTATRLQFEAFQLEAFQLEAFHSFWPRAIVSLQRGLIKALKRSQVSSWQAATYHNLQFHYVQIHI